jgi:hypothetical protein
LPVRTRRQRVWRFDRRGPNISASAGSAAIEASTGIAKIILLMTRPRREEFSAQRQSAPLKTLQPPEI